MSDFGVPTLVNVASTIRLRRTSRDGSGVVSSRERSGSFHHSGDCCVFSGTPDIPSVVVPRTRFDAVVARTTVMIVAH